MTDRTSKVTMAPAVIGAILLLATHASANTESTTAAATSSAMDASSALMLPFGDLSLAPADSELTWVDQRMEMRINHPDLHEDSRLRQRDDTGTHNDFRLEHSGNLMRIKLQR